MYIAFATIILIHITPDKNKLIYMSHIYDSTEHTGATPWTNANVAGPHIKTIILLLTFFLYL